VFAVRELPARCHTPLMLGQAGAGSRDMNFVAGELDDAGTPAIGEKPHDIASLSEHREPRPRS